MLTPEQQHWLETHLSDTKKVKIFPYDEKSARIFEKVKKELQERIGERCAIEEHGSTLLRIAGQDEIDVYIPVTPKEFDGIVSKLQQIYGEPRSLYPNRRARFTLERGGKRIDIFSVNRESDDYTKMMVFEAHLKSHARALEEYERIKQSASGLSVREYYRRKLEFINRSIGI